MRMRAQFVAIPALVAIAAVGTVCAWATLLRDSADDDVKAEATECVSDVGESIRVEVEDASEQTVRAIDARMRALAAEAETLDRGADLDLFCASAAADVAELLLYTQDQTP
jgi:hypothetical protein